MPGGGADSECEHIVSPGFASGSEALSVDGEKSISLIHTWGIVVWQGLFGWKAAPV